MLKPSVEIKRLLVNTFDSRRQLFERDQLRFILAHNEMLEAVLKDVLKNHAGSLPTELRVRARQALDGPVRMDKWDYLP